MRANILTHRFMQSNQGVAMIEFAFILPVLVLITFGAIEYGMYFLKSNMNNNNVAAAARAVQANPGDLSNRDLLSQTSLINHEDNKACAKSFATLEEAKAAECPPGLWDAMQPDDLPEGQTAYFVLIESNVASKSLSGLFDEGSALEVVMPTNVARQVIKLDASSGCKKEELADRSCYYAIENASINFSPNFPVCEKHDNGDSTNGAGADGNDKGGIPCYTKFALNLGKFEVSSSRTIYNENAQCQSGAWTCDHLRQGLAGSNKVSINKTKIDSNDQKANFLKILGGKFVSKEAVSARSEPLLLKREGAFPESLTPCSDKHVNPSPNLDLVKKFVKSGKVGSKTKGLDCWTSSKL